MPARTPRGSRSQRFTSQPRSGRAAAKLDASSVTRRRVVVESPTTSNRDTCAQGQPSCRAISGASRAFRSSVDSIPPASGTTDLTSTIRTTAPSRRRPITSTDPRSPRIANETSTAVSQPRDESNDTTCSTRPACAASTRRSRPSPCHRTRRSRSAPTAAAIRSMLSSWTSAIAPDSTFVTSWRDTPAVAATSSCRRSARIRRARRARPTRRPSTPRIVATAAYPPRTPGATATYPALTHRGDRRISATYAGRDRNVSGAYAGCVDRCARPPPARRGHPVPAAPTRPGRYPERR